MVKSGLRICGCADVDIDKLELNCIFRLGVTVRVGVRVRVSISIYLIEVIKLQIGSVLTNNIRRSANTQSAFYPLPKKPLQQQRIGELLCKISALQSLKELRF